MYVRNNMFCTLHKHEFPNDTEFIFELFNVNKYLYEIQLTFYDEFPN